MNRTTAAAFPPDFLWGAATAAYQVEGAPLADGAGMSNWHRFAHTPGRVQNGDTGDTACDHYHRYVQDIGLMRHIGLQCYRFSIAWARILPEGRGRINQPGLDFYNRLVDGLLEQGIAPCVTLYHWDFPATLDDRGGWLNRDSADWFADYAEVMFRALDDRVTMWITVNEPWVNMHAGYVRGVHAPGHCNLFEAPLAAHNLLRAHGAAVSAYRACGRHQIGAAVNVTPQHPASDTPEDVAAAARNHAYINEYFLDPMLLGQYPPALAEIFGPAWPAFAQADLDAIHRPIDFVGINYYTRNVVRHDPDQWPVYAAEVRQPAAAHTAMDWEIYPQGLTEILDWVRQRYANPTLYITENGAACDDAPGTTTTAEDELPDPLRRDYLRRHLLAAFEAIADGVDLRGYFVWSLLDNFEWAFGYSKRFGLVAVDYRSQKRRLKASAGYYREIIASNGAQLFADGDVSAE